MKQLNSTICVLLLASWPGVSMANDVSGGQSAGKAKAVEDRVQPPRSQRLRFRDGPVCMCSQGMSEEDIQRSREKRQKEDGREN